MKIAVTGAYGQLGGELCRLLGSDALPLEIDSLDLTDGPAVDRSKSWWVQAEAIISALYMQRFTGDPKYLAVFAQTFEYIDTTLIDREAGEWHQIITPTGQIRGDKASPWKAGYHNGRAMIECIEILSDWKP